MLTGLLLGGGALPCAYAAEVRGDSANYRAILPTLKPGDTLVLEPGIYRQGLPLHNLKGMPESPIRIVGPAVGPPAEFLGREGHNTVSLSNTAHVQIGRLVLNGNHLEVDAVKAEGHKACVSVHHIVLEDLLIVGHGKDQQVVGIASFCPAWNWVIRKNFIVGAGTGLYLGNSDGSAPFVGGLIEQNLLVDTLGYNLQIKHQTARPAGIGMPVQPTRTVIRHNLFTKVNHASAGIDARPNLLLGHFPLQGTGSSDVYEVANNLFYCNPSESLLQGEGNLSIARNLFINPGGDAVSIRPHKDVPRQVDVRQNFVAATGNGITIAVAEKPSDDVQIVAYNRILSPAAVSGGQRSGNQISPYVQAAASLAQWAGMPGLGTSRIGEMVPLLDVARRACGGGKAENTEASSRAADALRAHPACQIAVQLVALANAPPGAGAVGAVNFYPLRCEQYTKPPAAN